MEPTQTQEQEPIDEINHEEEKIKDDLEIDEYMNMAISQLSLDQRLSPNIQLAKSPSKEEIQPSSTPLDNASQSRLLSTPKLNDMSTSPIPIKSPSLIDAPLEREEQSSIEKELIVETDQLTADDSRGKY